MEHTDRLDGFFQISERKSSLKIEIIAGITTFLTMAYIIIVNASILSSAQVPGQLPMDKDAVIIVTCLISALSTIATGLIARVPIAMAPGMGLNAFFTYTLVIGKKIPWETALGIVFLSGLVFFILTIIGVRERVVKAIPSSLMRSLSVGIGLFIAFIGLRNLGLVIENKATLVTIGNFISPDGQWNMPLLIGMAGLFTIVVLEIFKVKGSILWGILLSTLLAVLAGKVQPGQSVPTYSIAPVFLKLDIIGALKWSFLGGIFTLMFTDMFDSVGTIVACSYEAGLVEKDGTIKKLGTLLTLDAVATMTGALLGTSTTTSYVESASGIEVGGRTGLTSIITGILFLLAIFFMPVFTLVPDYATAPALIIVGLFMMRNIVSIDFTDMEVAFPSFLAIISMPLTYSISSGLALGFISFTLIKILSGKLREVDPVMWIIAILSVVSILV